MSNQENKRAKKNSIWHPMKLWEAIAVMLVAQLGLHLIVAGAAELIGVQTPGAVSGAAGFVGMMAIIGLARRRAEKLAASQSPESDVAAV